MTKYAKIKNRVTLMTVGHQQTVNAPSSQFGI